MSDTYFKGKTAIITGSSGTIGSAIALAFAKRGCNLLLVDQSAPSAELLNTLAETEAHIAVCTCDVSSFQACGMAVDQAVSEFGSIEYLVNNAGIVRDSMIRNMTEEQWDEVFATDLKSCFNLTRHIWAVFEKRFEANGKMGSAGSIINMSSVTSYIANIGQSNYGTAKGAVALYTLHCAREFAKIGVTVNALAPGFIPSAITNRLQGAARERYLAQIPLKRMGTPEEVAAGAVFLAENRYITGQILHIDGGLAMQY